MPHAFGQLGPELGIREIGLLEDVHGGVPKRGTRRGTMEEFFRGDR
jgi:hypothetical protein